MERKKVPPHEAAHHRCTFCRRGLDQVDKLIAGPAEAFVLEREEAVAEDFPGVVVLVKDAS